MAVGIANYPAWAVQGGPLSANETAANVTTGKFVGYNSSGDVRLSDYRASQGPFIALGAVLENVVKTDPLGNTLFTGQGRGPNVQVSWTSQGKISGLTDSASAALTPGSLYYMTSGGKVTKTKPASATNDIDQAVGVAIDSSSLQIQLGQPIVHA